jgi:hypothetical protein
MQWSQCGTWASVEVFPASHAAAATDTVDVPPSSSRHQQWDDEKTSINESNTASALRQRRGRARFESG